MRRCEDPSDLELLEVRWRVVGPSRRVVTCAVYRPKGPGVFVRAGYSVDHFHYTRRVADVHDARMVADAWLTAGISIGYTEQTA